MVDTETNIDVIEALDFKMDDSCEHSQHSLKKDAHAGKGEWWQVYSVCPNCSTKHSKIFLVCDKWKKTVEESNSDSIRCKSCGVTSWADEWEVKFVRKDEL